MNKITSKFFIGFIVFSLLAVSAYSAPKVKKTKAEPSEKQPALLVGKVNLHIENVDKFNGNDLNGDKTKGLKITILEVETKKKFTVTSDENGVFYAKKLKVGNHYKMTVVERKSENDYGSQWVKFPINYDGKTLIKEGEVSVLFDITITYDGKTEMYSWQDPGSKTGIPEVKEAFKTSFPDSEWNNYKFEYNQYKME